MQALSWSTWDLGSLLWHAGSSAMACRIQVPNQGPILSHLHIGSVESQPQGPPVSQLSRSAMSNSLWPHGLQHARLPCPSPSPRACSNSCPLSQWGHPTISSSVIPFAACLPSFPASGSFPMSQFFSWGGQSIGASTSASVFPMNIQGWFPLGLTSLISLQSKGFSRVFSNTTAQSHQFFQLSFPYGPTLTSIHDYWKNHSFD